MVKQWIKLSQTTRLKLILIILWMYFTLQELGTRGESSLVEMGTTKTLVKVPKCNLSVSNQGAIIDD